MNEIKKRALALLAVPSIVTLMLTGVICFMAIRQMMPSEVVAGFYGSIVTYYFVKKAEQKEA